MAEAVSFDAAGFFEGTEAREIVARASTVAGMPVSLHDDGGEHVTGCGRCSACEHVAALPWGRKACRNSRERAVQAALRRHRPVPFLCHMGFSCLAVSALGDGATGYSLTFGPYCPSDAPDSLEGDALKGLAAISQGDVDELPFELSDIALASAAAVPEVAEWTAQTLEAARRAQFAKNRAETLSPAAPTESLLAGRGRRAGQAPHGVYPAAEIAAALTGGNRKQTRGLVLNALADTVADKRGASAVKRAKTLALVGAVLESAERAGLATSACWDRLPQFERALSWAKTDGEFASAAMGVLRAMKAGRTAHQPDGELNRLIEERLAGGVTLKEAAQRLACHPTAITHRLQRKFGMSFSEYVGRIRIDQAKRLLRERTLKMKDIGRRIGVADPANFSRLFRNHAGMSPSQYRKQFGRKTTPRKTRP